MKRTDISSSSSTGGNICTCSSRRDLRHPMVCSLAPISSSIGSSTSSIGSSSKGSNSSSKQQQQQQCSKQNQQGQQQQHQGQQHQQYSQQQGQLQLQGQQQQQYLLQQKQGGGSGIASDHVVVPLTSLTAVQQPQCVLMPDGQLGIVLPVVPAASQPSMQHPPWSRHVPPPRPPPLPPSFNRQQYAAPPILPQKRLFDTFPSDHSQSAVISQSANQLAAQELRKKSKRSGSQLPGSSTSSLASLGAPTRQDGPRHRSPTTDHAVQTEVPRGQLSHLALPGSQSEAVQIDGVVEGAATSVPAVAAPSPSAQLCSTGTSDMPDTTNMPDTSDTSNMPESVAALRRSGDNSELMLLGTGAAKPSKYRGPSCIGLRRHSCLLFPCSLFPPPQTFPAPFEYRAPSRVRLPCQSCPLFLRLLFFILFYLLMINHP